MSTFLSVSFFLEETAVREVYEETGVKSGTQRFYIDWLPLFTKDRLRSRDSLKPLYFNIARYAIPVVCDANRVARDAISISLKGGNLHLGGTVQ